MTSESLILQNMYDNGSIYIDNENTSSFITEDKQYKLVFSRKENTLFNDNVNFSYICNIDILNNLDLKLFNIQCTELDIIKLVDTFQYSLDNNLSNFLFFFDNIGYNNKSYGISLSMNCVNGLYSSSFGYRFNIFETNTNIIRLSTNLSDDNLYNLIDVMYVYYLLDIDIFSNKYNGFTDTYLLEPERFE